MSATERVEKKFWCSAGHPPGRPSRVAQVVVRDGARFLEIVGGRIERSASRRDELELARVHAEQVLSTTPDTPVNALRMELARTSIVMASLPLDEHVEPESHAIPRKLDVLARDAGAEPFEHPAACPRCHSLLWLTVRHVDGRWTVDVRAG